MTAPGYPSPRTSSLLLPRTQRRWGCGGGSGRDRVGRRFDQKGYFDKKRLEERRSRIVVFKERTDALGLSKECEGRRCDGEKGVNMETLFYVIVSAVKGILVISLLLLFVAYMTLVERKVLGRVQVRFGPNRVGPFGLLQPIADGIKSFTKEDLVPAQADKPVFIIAPAICIFTALCMFAVVPFGPSIELFGDR